MKRALLILIVTCALEGERLGAGSAHADVWQSAVDGKPAANVAEYDKQIAAGDEAAISASAKNISLRQIQSDIEAAVTAYRAAAKANPKSGEPWYRIGKLLYSFYGDCTDGGMGMPSPAITCRYGNDAVRMREIIEAWDELEARSPLDPRVNDILFPRAIQRTKLFALTPDKKLLEGAARDYKAISDRKDGLQHVSAYLVLGNLAETYMMLGKLEEAIDTYRDAIRAGAHTSAVYGLAVALDRDDEHRAADALALFRERQIDEFTKFKDDFDASLVFFVPAGEENYYFALGSEAFGAIPAAIGYWRAFLASGAHPQYQARAKQHLDTLLGKKSRPPATPSLPERGWPR